MARSSLAASKSFSRPTASFARIRSSRAISQLTLFPANLEYFRFFPDLPKITQSLHRRKNVDHSPIGLEILIGDLLSGRGTCKNDNFCGVIR